MSVIRGRTSSIPGPRRARTPPGHRDPASRRGRCRPGAGTRPRGERLPGPAPRRCCPTAGRCLTRRSRPDRRNSRGCRPGGAGRSPQPGSTDPPPTQQTIRDQRRDHRVSLPGVDLIIGEWQFRCRAEQLRSHDVRIGGVGDHPLHRFAQQRVRVVNEVGVQRVVPGHQHHQCTLAASAAAPGLLPERRDRPRKPGQHHGIQSGDVDAQLQGVGGGQPRNSPSASARSRARRSSARYPAR